MIGEVPQPEVDQACEEREVALERAWEGWEIYSSKEFSDLFIQTLQKALRTQGRESVTD